MFQHCALRNEKKKVCMIPGYARESKCVKLCSLSFSLFKKIKFKMAKILGNLWEFTQILHTFQVSS